MSAEGLDAQGQAVARVLSDLEQAQDQIRVAEGSRSHAEAQFRATIEPVSYAHLTLPTIIREVSASRFYAPGQRVGSCPSDRRSAKYQICRT